MQSCGKFNRNRKVVYLCAHSKKLENLYATSVKKLKIIFTYYFFFLMLKNSIKVMKLVDEFIE